MAFIEADSAHNEDWGHILNINCPVEVNIARTIWSILDVIASAARQSSLLSFETRSLL
jgi:hypothetical protein